MFFLLKRRKSHPLEDVHSYNIYPYPSLMQHSIPFPEHTLTSKMQHQQKWSPCHNARKIPSPPSSKHATTSSKTTLPTSHPLPPSPPLQLHIVHRPSVLGGIYLHCHDHAHRRLLQGRIGQAGGWVDRGGLRPCPGDGELRYRLDSKHGSKKEGISDLFVPQCFGTYQC